LPKVLIGVGSAVLALTFLVVVGVLIHQTVLIPPLAASMALIAAASQTPLAQPRNVIGGQVVSALTGYVVMAVIGHSPWSAAVAGGLAVGTMLLCRVGHSPAAATAVIVTVEHPPFFLFMGLLVLATVILVAVGVVGNRLGRQHYPTYWW
jgi:CBS-domain-containing membrane protein